MQCFDRSTSETEEVFDHTFDEEFEWEVLYFSIMTALNAKLLLIHRKLCDNFKSIDKIALYSFGLITHKLINK